MERIHNQQSTWMMIRLVFLAEVPGNGTLYPMTGGRLAILAERGYNSDERDNKR